MGSLLVSCREAALSEATFVWVDEDFLLEHGVAPWKDLPLWVPSSNPAFTGFYNININKALKAGLSLRPLAKKVNDTLNWLKTERGGAKLKVGMDIATETSLLMKFQQKREK
jgi:2'-hydroxyisoflavone reductase